MKSLNNLENILNLEKEIIDLEIEFNKRMKSFKDILNNMKEDILKDSSYKPFNPNELDPSKIPYLQPDDIPYYNPVVTVYGCPLPKDIYNNYVVEEYTNEEEK